MGFGFPNLCYLKILVTLESCTLKPTVVLLRKLRTEVTSRRILWITLLRILTKRIPEQTPCHLMTCTRVRYSSFDGLLSLRLRDTE